jgi:endonuclease V-like protein UPF0215 family
VAKRNFGTIVVGVVFRGNRWLDGVICNQAELREQNLISSISRTIRRSKQYSQLHAVIFAKQELLSSRELAELASSIKIPVIAILRFFSDSQSRFKAWPNTRCYELRVSDGKHIHVLAAGIAKEEAERILAIARNPSASVPEVVRVAELIVKQTQSLRFTR